MQRGRRSAIGHHTCGYVYPINVDAEIVGETGRQAWQLHTGFRDIRVEKVIARIARIRQSDAVDGKCIAGKTQITVKTRRAYACYHRTAQWRQEAAGNQCDRICVICECIPIVNNQIFQRIRVVVINDNEHPTAPNAGGIVLGLDVGNGIDAIARCRHGRSDVGKSRIVIGLAASRVNNRGIDCRIAKRCRCLEQYLAALGTGRCGAPIEPRKFDGSACGHGQCRLRGIERQPGNVDVDVAHIEIIVVDACRVRDALGRR